MSRSYDTQRNTRTNLKKWRDPSIAEWITIANADEGLQLTNERLVNFFRNIFRLLEINNMCFSSGSFVFEDPGNTLFNILTFDKFIVEKNSYLCKNPLQPLNAGLIPNPDVHVLGTETHDGLYYKPGEQSLIDVRPHACLPKTSMAHMKPSRRTTKFERILTPKVNNLCGYCREAGVHSESKGVILYYPMEATTNTYPGRHLFELMIDLLYVKFEGASVSTESGKHTANFFMSSLGIKRKFRELDTRKEDDSRCNYEARYLQKDVEFYSKYCPQDIPILEWYNTYLRVGCEFFVSKNVLFYFYKAFLYTNFRCENEEHIERLERSERSDISDVSDASERYDRSGRSDRSAISERSERSELSELTPLKKLTEEEEENETDPARGVKRVNRKKTKKSKKSKKRIGRNRHRKTYKIQK